MEFILMFGGIFCGAGLLLAIMAGMILILVKGAGGLFRSSSGWDQLALRFPGPVVPPGPLTRSSIRMGNVFYRNGIHIGSFPEGLYLVFKGAYNNPPILIPWQEISNPQKSILYWQPAQRVDICSPLMSQITVKEAQYQAMERFLILRSHPGNPSA